MAKGRKTGGRDFQKGVVTNPNGRPRIPEEIKQLRKLSAESVREVVELILEGNIQLLKDVASNPDSSVLKVWVAKAAATAIQKGDIGTLEIILNRAIGKTTDKLEVKGSLHSQLVAMMASQNIDTKE